MYSSSNKPLRRADLTSLNNNSPSLLINKKNNHTINTINLKYMDDKQKTIRNNGNNNKIKIKEISKKYNKNLVQRVKPYWIGQRLVLKIPNPKVYGVNSEKLMKILSKDKHHKIDKIPRIATIKDYNPKTLLTHIWYETKDCEYENVDLLSLDGWSVLNNDLISQQLPFVPYNQWVPHYYNIPQKVEVKFNNKYVSNAFYKAVIDGYDPISRRHHINYGDTTEWIWCTDDKVYIIDNNEILDSFLEKKISTFIENKNKVTPPPWDPYPYGLDDRFKIESIKIEKKRQQSRYNMQQNTNTNNNNSKIHLISSRNKRSMNIMNKHKKKIKNENKYKQESILLNPFMTRLTTNKGNKTITNQHKNVSRKRKKCEYSDDDMKQRAPQPQKKKQRTNKINVATNLDNLSHSSCSTFDTRYESDSSSNSEEIINKKNITVDDNNISMDTKNIIKSKDRKQQISLINISENNYNKCSNVSSQRQRINIIPKISQNINTSISLSSIKKKRAKYPRIAIIGGKKWKRRYSKGDKKYYWINKSWDIENNKEINIKQWDPWRLNNRKAPWMRFMCDWQKFHQPNSKKTYYYNHKTKKSTYIRPNNFESDEEILFDSDIDDF